MSDNSHIEWTDATWNPIAGCSVVSPGCTNCYAMRRVAPRLSGNPATPHYHGTVQNSKAGPVWTGKIGIASDDVLTKPLRRKKPTMYFVNSTSDLFHENVPDEVIDRIFAVMALCPQHTFQVLTKRSARMAEYFHDNFEPRVQAAVENMERSGVRQFKGAEPWVMYDFPLRNVWLGVSVEDQTRADERIPDLLATPAAVRFISAEPLLGAVDIRQWQHDYGCGCGWGGSNTLDYCKQCGWRGSAVEFANCPECREPLGDDYACPECDGHDGDGLSFGPNSLPRLDWVIVGGESGNGARPMHPDWARQIRDQCAAAGVPFFFKQWGEWLPISQMPDSDHLYYPAPEQAPEASRRCKVDSVCLDHLGKCFSTGKAGELHNIDKGAFVTKGCMSVFKVGKSAAGRLLDGIEHNAMPEVKP